MSKTLERADAGDGYTVTLSTGLGRTTTHEVQRLSTGVELRSITAPTGLSTVTEKRTDGSRATTTPDGTVTTLQEGPDPRFGMEAAIPASMTVAIPDGPTSTVATSRAVELGDPDDPLSLISSTETVAVNGQEFQTSYDAGARTYTSTTPEGRQTVTTVDAQGRPLSSQVTGILPVVREYDEHGRLKTITQGSGDAAHVTTFAYRQTEDNTNGYLDYIEDAMQRSTTFDVYDDAGRVKQETLPGNRIISFDYDENGNLKSLTPPGKPVHAFSYTAVDLLETYVPPVVPLVSTPTPTPTPMTTTYTYNIDRQLELVTRPDGTTIDYVYDTDTGRLTDLNLPASQTVQYAYHETTGNLQSITAADGTVLTLGYQGNLLTSQAWSDTIGGSVSRAYNNNFQVETQTVGSSTMRFAYDNDGLLTCAGAGCSPTPGPGDLALIRDAGNGLLTDTQLSYGTHAVTDTLSYNDFGEVIGYTAYRDTTELLTISYTRDKLGRIVEKTELVLEGSAVSTFYKYDPAGRLYRVCSDDECTAILSEYTYDDNGNRTGGSNPTQGAILGTTYDDQDRLLSYETVNGGAASYTYTPNGELATKTVGAGNPTTYTYDVLGNLRTVVLPNSDQIDYVVDGQNRRVGKKFNNTPVQGFLYDGQLRIVAQLDGSNQVVSRFVYGTKVNVPEYMIKDGSTYRLITDHLGSPRLVVNVADGTIAQKVDYDEFGNVLPTSTNPGFQPFGYAGGLYDPDTKLVRFGARDYDAETGRWSAKDPVGFRGRDANVYAYVSGNPINRIDPWGLQASVPSAIDWSPYLVPGAVGFSLEISIIMPWLSGGGGTVGFNIEWIVKDGLGGLNAYWMNPEKGSLSEGFSAGACFAFNAAYGDGSWVGPFETFLDNAGPFGASYFQSVGVQDAGAFTQDGYAGWEYSYGFGTPFGAAKTVINYTPIFQ